MHVYRNNVYVHAIDRDGAGKHFVVSSRAGLSLNMAATCGVLAEDCDNQILFTCRERAAEGHQIYFKLP